MLESEPEFVFVLNESEVALANVLGSESTFVFVFVLDLVLVLPC